MLHRVVDFFLLDVCLGLKLRVWGEYTYLSDEVMESERRSFSAMEKFM